MITMKNLVESVKRIEDEEIGLVQVPFLTDRLCASTCCHILNLYNIENDVFNMGGQPEDLRLHINFMAPSGWGKTLPYELFLNPTFGFISKLGIPTDVQSTYSQESWMGSITNVNKETGEVTMSPGIFERYKNGMLAADEFAKLAELMDGEGRKNDEVYLMTALSKRRAVKNLAYGTITVENIGTTLWAGMRPTRLNLKSGLARRFSAMIFMPTPKIAEQYCSADISGARVSNDFILDINDFLEELYEKLDSVESIDTSCLRDKYRFVSEAKYKETNQKPVAHFDRLILRKILIGYTLATGGDLCNIKITKDAEALLDNEVLNRNIFRHSPEHYSVYEIVKEAGSIDYNYLVEFVSEYYQIRKPYIKTLIRDLASIYDIVKIEKGRVCDKNADTPTSTLLLNK
jgi:hypothetical protein